jgi:hypothetical protein
MSRRRRRHTNPQVSDPPAGGGGCRVGNYHPQDNRGSCDDVRLCRAYRSGFLSSLTTTARPAIAEMLEPANWSGFDNCVKLAPELKLALPGAGLRERQQRDQAQSAARVLRVAYSTLAVWLVAFVVAVITCVGA